MIFLHIFVHKEHKLWSLIDRGVGIVGGLENFPNIKRHGREGMGLEWYGGWKVLRIVMPWVEKFQKIN